MKQKNGHFILDFRKTVDLDFKGFFNSLHFSKTKTCQVLPTKNLLNFLGKSKYIRSQSIFCKLGRICSKLLFTCGHQI